MARVKPDGGTYVWQRTAEKIAELATKFKRLVVIIVTDGDDNGSAGRYQGSLGYQAVVEDIAALSASGTAIVDGTLLMMGMNYEFSEVTLATAGRQRTIFANVKPANMAALVPRVLAVARVAATVPGWRPMVPGGEPAPGPLAGGGGGGGGGTVVDDGSGGGDAAAAAASAGFAAAAATRLSHAVARLDGTDADAAVVGDLAALPTPLIASADVLRSMVWAQTGAVLQPPAAPVHVRVILLSPLATPSLRAALAAAARGEALGADATAATLDVSCAPGDALEDVAAAAVAKAAGGSARPCDVRFGVCGGVVEVTPGAATTIESLGGVRGATLELLCCVLQAVDVFTTDASGACTMLIHAVRVGRWRQLDSVTRVRH